MKKEVLKLKRLTILDSNGKLLGISMINRILSFMFYEFINLSY